MSARSNTAIVRNPLLALPSAQAIKNLPPEAKAALRAVLLDIQADSRVRAEQCWRKHKAPMAAYWKAVAVYAGHTSRLARPEPGERSVDFRAVLARIIVAHDRSAKGNDPLGGMIDEVREMVRL